MTTKEVRCRQDDSVTRIVAADSYAKGARPQSKGAVELTCPPCSEGRATERTCKIVISTAAQQQPRKTLVSCFYQLLSGHAMAGPFSKNNGMGRSGPDKCLQRLVCNRDFGGKESSMREFVQWSPSVAIAPLSSCSSLLFTAIGEFN